MLFVATKYKILEQVAFILERITKAQTGSKGIARRYTSFCAQSHARVALPLGKRPGTHSLEARWTPEPVWRVAENLATTGIRYRTVQPVASRYTD
jgi:hypothetical protein